MNLSSLLKVKTRTAKRLGRGNGSGKGKTAGRGYKGQKARGKVPAAAVGGGLALYKKLPYRRGWTRHGGNPKRSPKAILVKLSQLNTLKSGSVVNINSLVENKVISNKEAVKKGVKILAVGKLSLPLIFELPVSKKAQSLIEQAGGKVVSK